MTEKVKAIKERIQAKETRSLWQKNIKDYAVQMLDSCNEDFKVDTLNVGDLVNHVDGNKYPLTWDTYVKNRIDIARICSDKSFIRRFVYKLPKNYKQVNKGAEIMKKDIIDYVILYGSARSRRASERIINDFKVTLREKRLDKLVDAYFNKILGATREMWFKEV